MDERGLCVWNGEWGPVYARREYEGDLTDGINEERYLVLKDQLEIYNKVSFLHSVLGVDTTTGCLPEDAVLGGHRSPLSDCVFWASCHAL